MTTLVGTALAVCVAGVRPVSDDDLRRVYNEVRTPFKYGIVLRGEGGDMVDCPQVFRHGRRWFMTYIRFDGSGYDTWIAQSRDLLEWRPLGRILSRKPGRWDAEQVAGFASLQDTRWGGPATLGKHDGRYWATYVGGALKGYETDPLSIGVAWTDDPSRPDDWERAPTPVLGPSDGDSRHWEKLTLYKSCVIRYPRKTLGAPFVMYYNAKSQSGHERIGMAVSHDMRSWKRYGVEPVVDNGSGISGDPQIVRMGDLWVMFYFGAFWRPGAFDTFAVSRDLVTWRKWTGPDLVAPSEPWDKTYAHKPWVIKHNGVVYHFYCAVGDQGRAIALATSRDLRADRQP
ncbi:MAG: glycosylase [Armatimonadetes bacterium]|nr:glycosylase [Armatimonadota bacterium]